MAERELPTGKNLILTNTNVWSPDSAWIVFDRRSDAAGAVFNGTTIERINIHTHEIQTLYQSRHGACVGVATVNPADGRVVFIHGPEHPTADWSYSICHREGAIVDPKKPGEIRPLDARDLIQPFTPGAHQGGTHVHTWDSFGKNLSLTYDDAISPRHRTIGLATPGPVIVPKTHPRNRDGDYHTTILDRPRRSFEDAWIPNQNAITFIGEVQHKDGSLSNQLFRIDDSLSSLSQLTQFDHHGIDTKPRHWPRTSPDGRRVACLTNGGFLTWVTFDGEVTTTSIRIESAFTWHPDGERLAAVVKGKVSLIHTASQRVTPISEPGVRPEACVVSPDGHWVAFVRRVNEVNRLLVAECRIL